MKITKNTKVQSVSLINKTEHSTFELENLDCKFQKVLKKDSIPDYLYEWKSFDFEIAGIETYEVSHNLFKAVHHYAHRTSEFDSLFTIHKNMSGKEVNDIFFKKVIETSKEYIYPRVGEHYFIEDNKLIASTLRGFEILSHITTDEFQEKHLRLCA